MWPLLIMQWMYSFLNEDHIIKTSSSFFYNWHAVSLVKNYLKNKLTTSNKKIREFKKCGC